MVIYATKPNNYATCYVIIFDVDWLCCQWLIDLWQHSFYIVLRFSSTMQRKVGVSGSKRLIICQIIKLATNIEKHVGVGSAF